jgi:gluconokinase
MKVIVVMGVSGSGKTTIASRLAAALGADYAEGDKFHPPANIEKMRSGKPLDDGDRLPWLQAMAAEIRDWRQRAKPTVLACSALKQRYRDILKQGFADVGFVYLRGSQALIAGRLAERRHEYMPATLLASQFAALEEPADAIVAEIDGPPEAIVATIVAQLRGRG